MNLGLQPYPAYKSNNVTWLGNIPKHWEVSRLKYILQERDERSNHGLEQLLRVSRYTGITERKHIDGTGNPDTRAMSLAGYKCVRQNDLVINIMLAWNASLGVSPFHGIVSPAYCVYGFFAGAFPKFFHYLLRSPNYTAYIKTASTGVVDSRLRLYSDDLYQLRVPLPPLSEQRAIVRYLDHVDRRIRSYIDAKQKLIALLEEEKQAIVNQAVTRGLDPTVRLKPSGVEWLGDVPEHWEVRRLGQIANSFRTGPFGSMLHQSDYIEGGTPVVNPVHMRGGEVLEDPRATVSEAVAERLSDHRLSLHDLVFSRRGELGRCVLIRDRESNWLCGTGSIRVRISYCGLEPEFLIQALQALWVGEYLSAYSVGTTMPNLNTGILKGVPVPLPPLPEQQTIVAYLECTTAALDAAITRVRRQIELVQEYRTRLIADVVTGKLDVREASAQLPNKDGGVEPIDEEAMMKNGMAGDPLKENQPSEEEEFAIERGMTV